jgi:hypothetical protein
VADNRLPNGDLSAAGGRGEQVAPVNDRRLFLQRTARVGLPALLVSVRARTVWAEDELASSAGSLAVSPTTADDL